MLTLTARHDRSQSLDSLLDALTGAWAGVQKRRAGLALRDLCVGWIRALEVTDGENGWHPHFHFLLLLDPSRGASRPRVAEVVEQVGAAWSELVLRRLGSSPSLERGSDLVWLGRDSKASRYVSKVAKEVTLSDTKSGRDPFALLDDATAANAARFVSFAEAIKGRQAIAWSRGLRDRLGLAEVSDEQILEGEVGPQWFPLAVVLPAADWNAALRAGAAHELLDELEAALPALLELSG